MQDQDIEVTLTDVVIEMTGGQRYVTSLPEEWVADPGLMPKWVVLPEVFTLQMGPSPSGGTSMGLAKIHKELFGNKELKIQSELIVSIGPVDPESHLGGIIAEACSRKRVFRPSGTGKIVIPGA